MDCEEREQGGLGERDSIERDEGKKRDVREEKVTKGEMGEKTRGRKEEKDWEGMNQKGCREGKEDT